MNLSLRAHAAAMLPMVAIFAIAALPRAPVAMHSAPPHLSGWRVATADTVITIRTEGSNLEFLPARISAKNGRRVTIRYVNDGTLPHNLVVLKEEDDLDTVGPAAYDAAETGYVPLDYRERFIAWTSLASPGDTVEVTFEMPPPGEYTFACLFPGHYNMMLGTIRSLR